MGAPQFRTRFIQVVFLAVCNVFFILSGGIDTNARVDTNDFAQFYIVSKRLHAGESIYDPFDPRSAVPSMSTPGTEASDRVRTANPPPLVLALWPLALLSYGAAWWCACIGTLLVTAAMSYRVSRELFVVPSERALWVAVGLGSFPTLVNGLLNHVEPWVWVLMVWGWLRLRKAEERSAGVLFGLAGCLKLFPLAIIPMLFAAQYRRASVCAFATAIVVFVVSVAVLGADSARAFFYEVLPQSARYRLSLGNISALSLLARLMPIGAAISLGGVFLLLTICLCRRHRSPDNVFVLGVTAALLCSPLSWTYYLILTLPCVMIAASWRRGDPLGERALLPFLFATLVYWPGLLGGWLGLERLPLPLVLAINYVPTLGLIALWRAAQCERSV
jgi:hypothetical protein